MGSNGKVVVGYVHPADVAAVFHRSLLALWMYDLRHNRRILEGGGHLATMSGANINTARNDIVRGFLGQTSADWLLMLDADMGFAPNTVDRLVEAAHAKDRPIVGGLCFGIQTTGIDDLNSWQYEVFPTLYRFNEDGRVDRYNEYPTNALFPVDATGAACLLVHRTVLAAMRDKYPEPFPWFAESQLNGQPVGEDMTFCIRAKSLGYPVFVHTGIKTSHAKTCFIDEQMFQTGLGGGRVAAEGYPPAGRSASPPKDEGK